jgi:signal transduction histidine kinase
VERIIENLLRNAARHTPEGTRMWLRVRKYEGGALIVVEDDGPGVPDALKGVVFEAFRQGEHDRQHDPGTGIGLSLVASFAHLHGGRAWVQDREGGGASFRVYLPSGEEAKEAGSPEDEDDRPQREVEVLRR